MKKKKKTLTKLNPKQKKALQDKEKGIVRVPRTAGTTQLCREINTTEDSKTKKRLKESLRGNILNRYIQDGFRLHGKTVDIQYLAQYLNMPVASIIRGITKQTQQLAGLTSKEGMEETYRALIATTLGGAMLDRGAVLKQVQTLQEAQGDQYVPFLSNALNKVLDTAINSHKPILELLRTLNPTPNTVIHNQNQQANIPAEDGQKYIGPNEASRMIDTGRQGKSLLTDEAQQEAIHGQHLEGQDLPEIVATKQQGFKIEEFGGGGKKMEVPHIENPHGDRSGDIDN